MSFIKNIIFFIFSMQERILSSKLKNTLTAKNFSKRKKHYSHGCVLSLDSIADSEKEKMEEELKLILKSSNYNPSEVLEYIKTHNTKVFYIENAKTLHSIGENEGFIYPQKGAKALYISLLTSHKISLKTDEMFILTKGEINKYYFIYHLYNWYTYKHNIIGIDAQTQQLLNKYLYNSSDKDINNLHLADIYKLKEAIKQDRSAIEFVFKLCQNTEGIKKAFDKLSNDGANL